KYTYILNIYSIPTRRSSDLEYFSKITKTWDNIFSFAKEYYENHEEDNFIKKADTENFYKSDASMDRLIESIYDTSLPNYYRREEDRKSTRLNSSHVSISYAV